MVRPLCIDLFCGLGGWSEGFLAEGWRVVGFDIERHDYGTGGYPGQLVLQDVLTLHGSQFAGADCIVASPPCQRYSYMAMPWTRAKKLAAWYAEDYTQGESLGRLADLNALFDACFRIQREAIAATGRHIPLVVENVNGAQRWVGPARWHYGSFYLWGDVPAIMPTSLAQKVNGFRFDGSGRSFQSQSVAHVFGEEHRQSRLKNLHVLDGLKFGGGWWHDSRNNLIRKASSRSSARKAASATIAKIPLPLASHIARVYKPLQEATA